MKKLLNPTHLLCIATVIMAPASLSASQIVKHRFNTASTANGYVQWWGSAPQTRTWDGTMDFAANPASGALKVTAGFNFASYGGDNQFAIRGHLSDDGNLNGLVVDATTYDHLEFDLYWDASSPTRTNGDYGGLDVGLVPTDYSQVWFNNFAITNPGAWTHIVLPINTNMAGNLLSLTNVGGVVIKMWSGDPTSGNAMTGTATFWVDNLKLVPKTFITDFDDNSYLTGIWSWWGGATHTVTWDPAHDAQNDTNSGSLNFNVTYSSGDQYAFGMSLSGSGSYNSGITIHTPSYSAVEFDLLWDTNSTFAADFVNTNGDPNGLGIGLATSGWGQTWPPNANQPRVVADGAWHHISVPLDPTWPDIPGFIFKKWFSADPIYTGTLNYWVDNLSFTPSSAPIPPPSMTLRPAATGLNLFLSQPGQQYQRESIRSIPADSIQWISNSDTVTYSMTLSDFPSGATYGGVQAHIFLVPDTAGGHAPDYADPNAIMLDIRENANGGGNATFRWKTNQPNGNSQMYTSGQGQVGTLNAATVLGKWSVSFANNTNITVSGPGGVVTNWTMPPDAAALFYSVAPSIGTYFGTQPNNNANIGQNIGITEIKVTSGATVVVDDQFQTIDPVQVVDPNIWTLEMDNPAGMFIITNQPSFWLGWSLPDSGFVLRQRPTLSSPGVDPGLTPILNGGARLIKLTPDVFPVEPQTYFYLLKQ